LESLSDWKENKTFSELWEVTGTLDLDWRFKKLDSFYQIWFKITKSEMNKASQCFKSKYPFKEVVWKAFPFQVESINLKKIFKGLKLVQIRYK